MTDSRQDRKPEITQYEKEWITLRAEALFPPAVPASQMRRFAYEDGFKDGLLQERIEEWKKMRERGGHTDKLRKVIEAFIHSFGIMMPYVNSKFHEEMEVAIAKAKDALSHDKQQRHSTP